MLQIDLDPVATSRGNVAARHHIRADAPLASSKRSPTPCPSAPAAGVAAELAHRLANALKTSSGRLPEVGVHWDLVDTSGHISAFTVHMPGRPHNRLHTISDFGAIGNGTAFADR